MESEKKVTQHRRHPWAILCQLSAAEAVLHLEVELTCLVKQDPLLLNRAHPVEFHFGEVAPKESHCILPGSMIQNSLHADSSCCLWNKLGAPHGVPTPIRRLVQTKPGHFRATCICRTLERRIQIEICSDDFRAILKT